MTSFSAQVCPLHSQSLPDQAIPHPKQARSRFQKAKARLRRIVASIVWRILIALTLLLAITTDSILPEKVFQAELGALTAGQRFNWTVWLAGAIGEEAGWWLRGRPLLADQASQAAKDHTLAFLDRQREISELEHQIREGYAQQSTSLGGASLALTTPPETLQQLEASLALLYQDQTMAAPQIERLLAAQVSEVLVEQGFVWDQMAWPPVTFRFNDLPTYLIVSPRDEIRQLPGTYLLADLPEGERAKMEAEVEAALDVSVLVTNVGGIGSWPTMVSDPVSLRSVLDVIAHEWAHTYLLFYPLGANYSDSQDLITMNETVASLVGGEVADLVIDRFYPELVPPHQPPSAEAAPEAAQTEEETFSQAMRRIRLHVDELLAAGKIEEAETYMEAERQQLVARGYPLRKLNQAYFAFHGSYATGPDSVDPIGPWMRELRAQSDSLYDFVQRVSQMESLGDLLATLDE